MDRSIKIVQQLMQATEPFCMMLKEVKERRKQLP
jgi:hypothetical protein